MTVIEEFEEEIRNYIGVEHAICCSNGTSGLHAGITALGVSKGDEIITTPFSFVASSNCILYNGGIPIFADINPKTYCISPSEVEKQLILHPDVKGIICVHLFGKYCEMDKLREIANSYEIFLLEDSCQYIVPDMGVKGDLAVWSFYATKQLWTFEGGMIGTNNDYLAKKIRMIINHGQSSKYVHEILGYNYRMSQMSALIGVTQLKLHKKGILAELGSYGIKQGHYPYVIYDQPLYKQLGIKGNCPNAEKVAMEARKYWRK